MSSRTTLKFLAVSGYSCFYGKTFFFNKLLGNDLRNKKERTRRKLYVDRSNFQDNIVQ